MAAQVPGGDQRKAAVEQRELHQRIERLHQAPGVGAYHACKLGGRTTHLLRQHLCRSDDTGQRRPELVVEVVEERFLEAFEVGPLVLEIAQAVAGYIDELPNVTATVNQRDFGSLVDELLTGNIEPGARLKLQAVDLWHRFDFGAYGSDHERRDQLPAVAVRRAREHSGIEFSGRDIVIIGDTPFDVTCGAALGVWTVAVATFKSETYRFLRLERPTDEETDAGILCPAGFVHLPHGVDAEWVKQLVAEQLVTVKTKRGFTRLEWQKLRERNEALDCRVYARAAAWIAGIDRWSERKWRDLERALGVDGDPASDAAQTDPSAVVAKPERRHRPPARRAGSWLGGRQDNWLRR